MAISKAEKARRAEVQREALESLRAFIDGAPVNRGHGVHQGTGRRTCAMACEGHVTLWVTLTHLSRGGASRRIKVLGVDDKTGDIVNLSFKVGPALGLKVNYDEGSVVIGGGGMDMGFHLVSSLSVALYGHENRGGYRLRKEWI